MITVVCPFCGTTLNKMVVKIDIADINSKLQHLVHAKCLSCQVFASRKCDFKDRKIACHVLGTIKSQKSRFLGRVTLHDVAIEICVRRVIDQRK